MSKKVLNFINNNIKTILILLVFLMGVFLGFQRNTINNQSSIILEMEFENKRLDKLINQEKIKSDSIELRLKSLLIEWKDNSTPQIIEKIRIKYEKIRDTIVVDHNQQFDLFSNWLPKEDDH